MAALGSASLLLHSCGGSSSSPAPAFPAQRTVVAWSTAFGNANASTTNPASSEQTFRDIVKPTVSGRSVSVHFSNIVGTTPLTIGSAHIGIVAAGAKLSRDVALTFGGKSSVTIAAGGAVSSDAAALTFAYGAKLAVTEYLRGAWPSLPQHNTSGLWSNYATSAGAGDATSDFAGTSFTTATNEAFVADRVDVIGSYKETVAFLGSSTTVGVGSDPGKYDDMIDDIADNLHAAGIDTIGLANVAIAPDSLLPQNEISANPSAISRFGTDVVPLPGIAIVLQNAADVDLKFSCDSAQTVISGDRTLVSAAHAAGIKIYLAVIAPTTYCNGQNPSGFGSRFPAGTGEDLQRELLNGWIASTAASTVNGMPEAAPGADAIVDIATPITDPSNTGYMLPRYDSGDDSHANAAGQAVQAAQFPAALF